ncbi:MAG: ABC transporter permease [Clostridia bacterium]|nr:ABC transporter permease [Clostridia bacterium]
MFFHNLKYSILQTIKQKEIIMWFILFPFFMITVFFAVFNGLGEKTEHFNDIPVAVVFEKDDKTFKTVLDEISKSDEPIFNVTYADKTKAQSLLKNGDVNAIITVNDDISMSVSESGIANTIVHEFITQYRVQKDIINETAKNNPEKIQDVINSFSKEQTVNENISLSNGNMDVFVSFFFSLIAMIAMNTANMGVFIATENQGNLSKIGARKCLSPTPKIISILSSYLANCIVAIALSVIAVTYILILGVNLGNKIAMIYLSAIIGSITGISFGFFVGSIGRMSSGVKFAISMVVTMTSYVCSGLMSSDIKVVIDTYVPIINKLNPTARIADMLYCLNIYDDYRIFTEHLVVLLIMTVIFITGGFMFTRRKKYASL